MSGLESISQEYVTTETLDVELEGWMAEVEPYQWRDVPPLDVSSSCLIVVDMTKPFIDRPENPLCSPNGRAIVGRVGELVSSCRSADLPVIWVNQGHKTLDDRGELLCEWWPNPIMEGTEDVELCEGLAVEAGDAVVIKRRYSSFYETELETILRQRGVSQVIICGVLTGVCPFTTAFDAFMRGFRVYYPADCTAAPNREMHIGALRTVAGWCGHVVRAGELIRQLGE